MFVLIHLVELCLETFEGLMHLQRNRTLILQEKGDLGGWREGGQHSGKGGKWMLPEIKAQAA